MDRVRNYLSNVQTRYRTNDLVNETGYTSPYQMICSYNPSRITLYIQLFGGGDSNMVIRTQGGVLVPYYGIVAGRIYHTWTIDQHLVYQEFGITGAPPGNFRGFEVLYT